MNASPLRPIRNLAFGLLLLICPARATATDLARWMPSGSVNSATPLPAGAVAPGVSAGSLTKAPALTGETFPDAFLASGWTTGSFSDPDRYFEFAVTADAGNEILFDGVEFSLFNDFDGTARWELRSSEDGFGGVLDGGVESGLTGAGSPVHADVSRLGARKGTVTFRLHVFGNQGTSADRRGLRGTPGGGGDLHVLGAVQTAAESVPLATWMPNGSVNSASPLAASSAAAMVSAGSLSRSATLGALVATDAFLAGGWPVGTGIDLSRYLEFKVTAADGARVLYDCVEFSLYNAFAGASGWELRSSEDSFSGVLDAGLESAITGPGAPIRADVSRLGSRKGTVVFRLYTHGNSGTTDPDRRGLRGSSSGGLDLRVLGRVEPSGTSSPSLASWAPVGSIDSSVPLAPLTVAPNVTAAPLEKSAALTPETFTDAFVASGWPTGIFDASKYFEFRIAADSGWEVVYDCIEFHLYNNQIGASRWEIRSGEDGFRATLDGGVEAISGVDGALVRADISSLGSRKGCVVFRFYTHENSGGLNPDRRGIRGRDGLDLEIFGTVQPAYETPEIATWLVNGSVNSATPFPPSSAAANVVAGTLAKSTSLTAQTFTNAFVASGWPTGSSADLTRYLEFQVTALPGYRIAYNCMEFSVYNDVAGEAWWELRSSEDGFRTPLDGCREVDLTGDGSAASVDLSTLGTRKGSVTFRLYTFGNTGAMAPDRRGLRGTGSGGLGLRVYGSVEPTVSDTLATWVLNGTVNSAAPLPVTSTASGVSGGGLTRAATLTAQTFSNAFVASGWPLTSSIDLDRHFEFEVAADPGMEIRYDCVQFSLYNNFAGTSQWEVRSSEDGFRSPLDGGVETLGTASGTAVRADVSAVGSRGGSVVFRLYTHANTGATFPDRRGLRGSGAAGLDLGVFGVLQSDQVSVPSPRVSIHALEQSRPNPFGRSSPVVTIGFHLRESGRVDLAIFDLQGRLVRRLLEAHRPAGRHSVAWSGDFEDGSRAPAGVYFYRLTAGGQRLARKLILLR